MTGPVTLTHDHAGAYVRNTTATRVVSVFSGTVDKLCRTNAASSAATEVSSPSSLSSSVSSSLSTSSSSTLTANSSSFPTSSFGCSAPHGGTLDGSDGSTTPSPNSCVTGCIEAKSSRVVGLTAAALVSGASAFAAGTASNAPTNSSADKDLELSSKCWCNTPSRFGVCNEYVGFNITNKAHKIQVTATKHHPRRTPFLSQLRNGNNPKQQSTTHAPDATPMVKSPTINPNGHGSEPEIPTFSLINRNVT